MTAWLDGRRPAPAAAAADQRDAAGRVVALLRPERDGDRSAVHFDGAARGFRRDWRRGVARAGVARGARCRARRAAHRLSDGPRPEADGAAARLRAFSRHRMGGRDAPRLRVPRLHARRNRGGSTTTRCSGRCTRGSRSARGPTGRSRCARASPMRSRGRARRAGRRPAVPPVPAVGGGRPVGQPHATRPARSRCLATCRSW